MKEQVCLIQFPSPFHEQFGDSHNCWSLNVSIGGGSASDSGRSIASSVSTEPFFSGQSVATETQPATETATQAQTQTQTETDANASANNNEQSAPNAVEPSTSQVPELQPEDINESQDTNELKDAASASNDDNADVINVYSSGDEGKRRFIFY